MKKILSKILLVVLIAVFVFSGAMVAKNYIQGKQEQSAFDSLAAGVTSSADDGESGNINDDGEEHIMQRYAAAYEKNNDMAAWLTVPNTNINYPVMLTTADPNYYLRRAFDGTSATSGTPFIGEGCTMDGDCIIVYGHNMKNNTMFGTLDYYDDEAFFTANPLIEFNSLYSEQQYQVFAAVKCKILYEGDTGYKYYEQGGSLSDEDYAALVKWLTDNSLYDTGFAPQNKEQIVILSTCSYHTDDGRFLVAAYKVSE